MQTLHIPTYIHIDCFLLCSPYIFLASFVLSFLVAFEVPRICNWLQLIAKCIGLKIEDSQKTSSIQVWVEDWRFSEKLLQSNPGLKIEDSQKNFFNPILDWRCEARPGLKKFFWESSIFNLQIQTWIEEGFLRIFNLQSSFQTWTEEVFLRIFNLQSDTFCN